MTISKELIPPLNDVEKEAKDYLSIIYKEASIIPIDTGKISEMPFEQPDWIDVKKFNRGREYFKENRFGIMISNMYGLVMLLAEPTGLKMLMSTEKSSTIETARKRYVSTLLHMLSWYEFELKPGSEAWTSLNKVRKMHLAASNAAISRKDGIISQAEVAITGFGFMGLALIKPHHLSVNADDREGREGFVHFWAVMLYMIGVQDRYNFCLKRLEVVEMICHALIRYVFVPILQIESPGFKHMFGVLIDGLKQFLPDLSYESQVFMTRRICGIPGYQFNVDLSKEFFCRDLFTEGEIEDIKKTLMDIVPGPEKNASQLVFHLHHLLVVREKDFGCEAKDIDIYLENVDDNQNITGTYKQFDEGGNIINVETEDIDSQWVTIRKYFGLSENVEIIPHRMTADEWLASMNSSKFDELSFHDRLIVRLRCHLLNISKYSIFRKTNEWGLQRILNRQKDWHKKNTNKNKAS